MTLGNEQPTLPELGWASGWSDQLRQAGRIRAHESGHHRCSVEASSFLALIQPSSRRCSSRRASISMNAIGNHHKSPITLTCRKIIPNTINASRRWIDNKIHNDIQKVRRGQLIRRRRITVEKGTTVPKIAVCHLCGIPDMSIRIAITPALMDAMQTSVFSIHGLRGRALIVPCIADMPRLHLSKLRVSISY
jgi:hypothetical protein